MSILLKKWGCSKILYFRAPFFFAGTKERGQSLNLQLISGGARGVEAYNAFAKVYDVFMEDTPYEKWKDFIFKELEKYKVTPKIMCDLGCGTGTLSRLFAKEGIEMIGIDGSEEMLMEARELAMEEELNILYLMQEMSEFELYGTVDVIYSSCDSLNYLLEEEALKQTFKWVNNYLEPKGLFIFDMNMPYKYKNILGEHVFAQQSEDAAYIWENYYDEEEQMNEFIVNFFIQNEEGTYERTEEEHYQRAYELEHIKRLLKEAGLELLAVYDDYSDLPYTEQTERATFVAREYGKRKE